MYIGTRCLHPQFLDFACFRRHVSCSSRADHPLSEVAEQLASGSSQENLQGVAFFSLGMARRCCSPIPAARSLLAAFHWLDSWFGIVAYSFRSF
jgi:hypothetical protein